MDKSNISFFGTPDMASKTLDILNEAGYQPKVIVTSPDKPSGRGMHTSATPVGIWADSHNIKCLKPEKIDDEFIDKLRNLNINLTIVVAYGKILPEELIELPSSGTINIHYSLLPKYRGASPVEQALLSGDKITGVTIQQMAYKLDSGAIICKHEVNIDPDETKTKLLSELVALGGKLLVSKLPDILRGNVKSEPQDESFATYCKKIKKSDGLIDIKGNSTENYNKYRAFEGWPGTYFFTVKNAKETRVKIKKAKLEDDLFVIERVVPEGKKEIDYNQFLKTNT